MNYIHPRIKTIKKIRETILKVLNKDLGLKTIKEFIDAIDTDPIKSINLLTCLLFDDNLTLLAMLVDEGFLKIEEREHYVLLTAKELQIIRDSICCGGLKPSSFLSKINSALEECSPLERL